MTSLEKANLWLEQDIDSDTREEINTLITGPSQTLEDAFYKDLEFGTGGMRGVMGVGSNRVNKYTLGKATQGLANYLKKQFAHDSIKVAIAHDCRNNSETFTRLVADVLSANGIQVLVFESLRPTPELSFAVRHYECQSGIVITASHNPPEYNGYKVYWDDGAQIVSPHDTGIIEEVNQIERFSEINFTGRPELIKTLVSEADQAFIHESLRQRKTKKAHPLKIVFTSLHGTSITIMPELLKQAGYKDVHIVEAQSIPDGNFPTVESPNPEEKAALDMALKLADDISADMVVGTDPDSDRLGVAIRDESGDLILLNGNQCGVMLTEYILSNTDLKDDDFIAYTIVSSDLFRDVAKSHGVKSEVCLTGFKHIAALIRQYEGERRFLGGGEESYGYMVGDFVRDKDALTSTLLFCDLAAEAKSAGSSAWEFLKSIYEKNGLYCERLISITKKGQHGAEEISQMMDKLRLNAPETINGEKIVQIDDLSIGKRTNWITGETKIIELPSSNVLQFYTDFGAKVSARPSGTEPKIKFYISVREQWRQDLTVSEQEKILNKRIDAIIEDLNL